MGGKVVSVRPELRGQPRDSERWRNHGPKVPTGRYTVTMKFDGADDAARVHVQAEQARLFPVGASLSLVVE